MKNKKVSPTAMNVPTTENLQKSFGTKDDQLNIETIEKANPMVTNHNDPKAPVERNQRKRETLKGTILQAVMIEKELLKKVKYTAYYNEKSISEVVNQALRLFYD